MVFAMGTRASFSARLKWFKFLDWWRVSCVLRALAPCSREDKSAQKPRPGFGDVVNKDGFDELRGLLPAQPDDKSRVWEVASFAA